MGRLGILKHILGNLISITQLDPVDSCDKRQSGIYCCTSCIEQSLLPAQADALKRTNNGQAQDEAQHQNIMHSHNCGLWTWKTLEAITALSSHLIACLEMLRSQPKALLTSFSGLTEVCGWKLRHSTFCNEGRLSLWMDMILWAARVQAQRMRVACFRKLYSVFLHKGSTLIGKDLQHCHAEGPLCPTS